MPMEPAREAIFKGASLQGTLAELARLAEADAPGFIAGFTVVDETNMFVREAVFPSLPNSFQDSLAYVPLTEPYIGSCVQSIRTGKPVISNDILGDMRFDGKWRELCLRFGLKSIRSEPLPGNAYIEGSFVLARRDLSSDEAWDAQIMTKYSQLGSEAIQLYRTLAVPGAT